MVRVLSPNDLISVTARIDRPIKRCISWLLPETFPFADSRSLRVSVARGSIEYSAVTQPVPLFLKNGGTLSSTDTEQTTRVRPNSINTEPSAKL
jgi:hypothetical protein